MEDEKVLKQKKKKPFEYQPSPEIQRMFNPNPPDVVQGDPNAGLLENLARFAANNAAIAPALPAVAGSVKAVQAAPEAEQLFGGLLKQFGSSGKGLLQKAAEIHPMGEAALQDVSKANELRQMLIKQGADPAQIEAVSRRIVDLNSKAPQMQALQNIQQKAGSVKEAEDLANAQRQLETTKSRQRLADRLKLFGK